MREEEDDKSQLRLERGDPWLLMMIIDERMRLKC